MRRLVGRRTANPGPSCCCPGSPRGVGHARGRPPAAPGAPPTAGSGAAPPATPGGPSRCRPGPAGGRGPRGDPVTAATHRAGSNPHPSMVSGTPPPVRCQRPRSFADWTAPSRPMAAGPDYIHTQRHTRMGPAGHLFHQTLQPIGDQLQRARLRLARRKASVGICRRSTVGLRAPPTGRARRHVPSARRRCY